MLLRTRYGLKYGTRKEAKMAQESFFMADTLVVWLELPDASERGVQVYICQG